MQGYTCLLAVCMLVTMVTAVWDDEISDPEYHTREKRDLTVREKIKNKNLMIATINQVPYTNITQGRNGQKEYYGFIPDLIFILSRRLKFNYQFYEVDRYGAFVPGNNQTKGYWTGAVGELIKMEKNNGTGSEGADIAAMPLTITRAREEVVDFVKPFQNLGLTILVKKPHMKEKGEEKPLWPFEFSIFEPLMAEVWVLVSISVIVVGLILWGMNMFNPYEWGGRYNLGLATEAQSMSFNLPGSLWFVFSTLQWQGFERAPRSMAAKLLTCIWFAFVTLVLVTYTGSLVNHLYWASMVHGTDPTRAPLRDLTDLVQDKNWKYGTIKGGSTFSYLTNARGIEYMRMKQYWQSEGAENLVNSTEAGFEKVRTIENYAFILESMTAKHEVNKQPCDVMTVGTDFAARSYGLAVPKNSPILEELHHAVLEMGENGDLEMLERRWYVDRGECWNYTVVESLVSKASSLMVDKPKRVSLRMFWGPLVLMIVGVILSLLLAGAEIAFYKYKGRYLQSNRPQGQTLKLDPDEGNI